MFSEKFQMVHCLMEQLRSTSIKEDVFEAIAPIPALPMNVEKFLLRRLNTISLSPLSSLQTLLQLPHSRSFLA